MANKLVQQQLKNILRSLNDHDLEKLLSNFEALSNAQITKECRMVSYKCYEATMAYKTWTANGFGRAETEATNNCIKNFLEMIMEDEMCLSSLIKALKKGSESVGHAGQNREHGDRPNVNSTLALNGSYAQVPEHNTSFENRRDLEILSKNIGNISVIGNTKPSGDNNPNASQLEMDDLLLKMMLEDGTNLGGQNNFRKSLPPQHPNGPDLGGTGQSLAAKVINNTYKAERSGSYTGGNTKKTTQESPNQYNSTIERDQIEEKQENRYDSTGHANKFKSTGNSYKNVDYKNQQQYAHGYSGEAGQRESYKETKGYGGSEKCSCSCSEQLQRANLRIESLEKKLKLLTEENKILKYLATESKEVKSELSTMTSTNPLTKNTYDKSPTTNYDFTPKENFEDVNEFPEREAINPPNDYKRSVSVDAYARRKALQDSQNNTKGMTSINKENNESMEKRDAKKMVPRLKLEMIPNYHAKYSNPSNALGTQNLNVTGGTKTYTQQALQNPSSTIIYSQNSFESGTGIGNSNSTLSKYLKK